MDDDELVRGRQSFERDAWRDAYERLVTSDRGAPLPAPDLERLALAAQLVGEDSTSPWERAHREWLVAGDPARAARCAFWLGLHLMQTGEPARGGGWLARARRELDDAQLDCAERGLLLVPEALQALYSQDPRTAYGTFSEAAAIGDRYADADLMTLARLGQGQALIDLDDAAAGIALVEEAMLAVTADEVSPVVAGVVYCAAIEACQDLFDLRRAREWTGVLVRWCASHPDMVPFRAQCLVHRAQVLQLQGAWPEAQAEAEHACAQFALQPGHPAVGSAHYEQAELHRLRGDAVAAEAAYREASRCGCEPQPGLALLWLAQGRVEAAEAAMTRIVDQAQGRAARARLLGAHVEVLLAVPDVTRARSAADELVALADDLGAPMLRAMANCAVGAVLLAEGESRGGERSLRLAWASWHELAVPYEAARARALLASACRVLGDHETAEMELDEASRVFRELGATPDAVRVDALLRRATSGTGGLTGREVEVLALVATGQTNRDIAGALSISEKTVARHVSNIFTKLGLSSRSAATAYAFKHDLA